MKGLTPGYRARAPIGSQAGSTIGSASRAPFIQDHVCRVVAVD